MNLFNCFQAVAFYTLTPFLIQYLLNNGMSGWAYVAMIGEIVGFIALSISVHEGIK